MGFFDLVQLQGLYAEDLNKDTLIYAGELNVSINLFSLVGKKINISSVELKNSTANLTTNRHNGNFNFQFFIDAFVSEDSSAVVETPTDRSAAWSFGVDELLLSNVRFRLNDPYNGLNVKTRIGNLAIEMDEFDLNREIIKAESIHIDQLGLAVELFQGNSTEISQDTSELSYQFGAESISIEKSNVSFIDQLGGIHLKTAIGKLDLTVNDFDLIHQKINVESLKVAQTKFNFNQEPIAAKETEEISSTDTASQDWLVDVGKVNWKEFELNYNDNNVAPTKEGIDFSHLGIHISNLEGSNLHYNGIKDITASFSDFSVTEDGPNDYSDVSLVCIFKF